ncbi:SMP-30/gluconolactonase/LRE family protein [Streptomyces halobius]|uniref:NHL repeat-containing protein n=1 Tax=Streptomyces halobius TaxID=2879846 RepID=A0ABY4ML18_9ACTN|nr:hypothetical protein [Streptomyces halobius]UQA97394.1 hypothetical protein K9S39_40995 [Streptomyces halobius]
MNGPGGIRRGPDGMMYVNHGVNPLASGLSGGGIMRFDPTAAEPEPEKVVEGISGLNGLAIDADGNFSLGREFAAGVLKIRPDGTKDEAWTAGRGPDDLTHFDGDLVVAGFRDGELIRVDPATGRSCVLVAGLRMPTSVRVPWGFGGHDPRSELFVTEASGRVVTVRVGR